MNNVVLGNTDSWKKYRLLIYIGRLGKKNLDVFNWPIIKQFIVCINVRKSMKPL